MNDEKFNKLDEYFKENKFERLESDEYGERFLKLRTISRSAELKEFCKLHNINHSEIKEDLFCYIFKREDITINKVDTFIR